MITAHGDLALRRGRERLDAWRIEVRPYEPGRLGGAAEGGLLTFLGSAFRDFWKSEALPSGPPKGASLARPVLAAPWRARGGPTSTISRNFIAGSPSGRGA
jgi:hypothetical protein